MGGAPTSLTTAVARRPKARAESVGIARTPLSLATPEDVLYAGELQRGRLWVVLCTLMSIGGIGSAALFVEPGTTARLLLAGSCGVLLIASLIGLWVLRSDDAYSPLNAALFGYTSLLVFMPACYFFGWFSAIVVLVGFGGIIFAMGHSTRQVVIMAAVAVAGHSTLAVLTIAEVIPDRGVASIRVAGIEGQLACLAIVESLFVLAFLIGRRLRTHAHAGVDEYGRIIRESARREALLEEAREELERARQIGGPGRYTGLTVGEFELGSVIGRGGMGEVYEGTHRASGENAAVKVMLPTGTIDSRARQRFEREIGMVAALDSPHIVRVLDHSSTGSDVLYLAMERLRGESLSDMLRSSSRTRRDDLLEMLRQIARGVDALHAGGVIHRDLTPRNIFHHTGDGQDVWKVLDFGVSRVMGASPTLTGGAVVGTPNYMSPEQASSGDVDNRSDLFSLACVAYRCLTGRPPFTGKEIAHVLYQVVHDMPPRPSLIARLPPAVDLVLAIGLAKDREHRFGTAADLAAALADAQHGRMDDELERRGSALVALQPWRKG